MLLKLKTYLGFLFFSFTLLSDVFGTKFEREIFKVLAQRKSQENLIFSPISIEVALALGYFATKGESRKEIGELLDLPSNIDQVERIYDNLIDGASAKYNMSIVNKIWLKNSLEVRQRFQEIAKRSFNSEVSNVDFSDTAKVANEINSWIEEATNHKLMNVFSKGSIDAKTLMVLLNVVYFKGQWENKFRTKKSVKFSNHGRNAVFVNGMSMSRPVRYADLTEINATAVELPYKNSGLSMVILLPKDSNGLGEMESKLASLDVMDLVKTRLKQNGILRIIMPKFTIQNDLDLVDLLKEVGVHRIFTKLGDFSGLLAGNEEVLVSKATHSAFIDVNEDGTEAAAATRLNIMQVAGLDLFIVDHPFAYLIKDNERVYFMGHVVKL